MARDLNSKTRNPWTVPIIRPVSARNDAALRGHSHRIRPPGLHVFSVPGLRFRVELLGLRV